MNNTSVMLVSKNDILNYIPQRPPFVMVDSILSIKEDVVISNFTIPDNNPMVCDDRFQEGGLIENIAQTAAAGVGYDCIINNKPVILGFIGAVKKLFVYRLPKSGDLLETKAETITKIMNATIIKGTVKCNEILLIECEINIFVNNEN